MSSNSDMITWGMMLRKIPSITRAIPRLIKGVNVTKLKPDQPCGLGWAFEQAVQRNPHGPALLYKECRFSYEQVNQWANRIAHYLLARGLKKAMW